MQHLQPKPTRSRGKQTIFLHSELHKCTHAFVRRDSVRRPLQAPYDDPYPVIKRSDKFYKVNIPGKPTSISIDRLKPAFTHNVDDTLHLEESDAETKRNLRKTRSGRRVHISLIISYHHDDTGGGVCGGTHQRPISHWERVTFQRSSSFSWENIPGWTPRR
ncbi:gag-pol polyprotein [Trichonephila clavipes]|nr:gag-pol polyprotein [Trichonephila clavipes]